MKKLLTIVALAFASAMLSAQTPKNVVYEFTEASDLNLIGKIHKETPNPYHRVDTVKYKGFTVGENRQVRCPAGLAVLFKTNSTSISVKTEYGWEYNAVNTMPIAYRGYDLYIKDGDQWLWAGSGATKPENGKDNLVIVKDMDKTEKECMLYLPIYSEVYSVKIGTDKGSKIEALESPFRHQHQPSCNELPYAAYALDRSAVPQPRMQRKLQDAALFR